MERDFIESFDGDRIVGCVVIEKENLWQCCDGHSSKYFPNDYFIHYFQDFSGVPGHFEVLSGIWILVDICPMWQVGMWSAVA